MAAHDGNHNPPASVEMFLTRSSARYWP